MEEYSQQIDKIKSDRNNQEENEGAPGVNVKSVDSLRIEGLRFVEKLKDDIEEASRFQIQSAGISQRRKSLAFST